jgi:hypothetical protein
MSQEGERIETLKIVLAIHHVSLPSPRREVKIGRQTHEKAKKKNAVNHSFRDIRGRICEHKIWVIKARSEDEKKNG